MTDPNSELDKIFIELEANLADPKAILGYSHAVESVKALIARAIREAREQSWREAINAHAAIEEAWDGNPGGTYWDCAKRVLYDRLTALDSDETVT